MVLSKVFNICDLVTKNIEFTTSIRLTASFLKALAKRSIDWREMMVADEIEVILFLVHSPSWGYHLLVWSQVIFRSSLEFFRRTDRLVLFLSDIWINKIVLPGWKTTHLDAKQLILLKGMQSFSKRRPWWR